MRRMVMVVAILALLASSAAVVLSQGPAGGGMRGGGMGMGVRPAMSALAPPYRLMSPRASEQLSLTEEQKTKLKTATDEYTKETEAAQPKVETARKALSEGLMNPATTDADLQKLIAAAQEADKCVVVAQMKLWKAISTILTAEQLETLATPPAGGGGGFGGRRGNRGN